MVLVFGVTVYRFSRNVGYWAHATLLPYQAGVFFRKGHPSGEVGPGRHRVFLGREKIHFLDVRPIEVRTENRGVYLANGKAAVYGFSASARVSNVTKALYASSNYTQLPAFATLAACRSVLNQSADSASSSPRAALEEQVANDCKIRLAALGFELISFKLTQFAVQQTPEMQQTLPE